MRSLRKLLALHLLTAAFLAATSSSAIEVFSLNKHPSNESSVIHRAGNPASPGDDIIKQQAQVLATLQNKLRNFQNQTVNNNRTTKKNDTHELKADTKTTKLAYAASSAVPVRSKSGRLLSRMQPAKRQAQEDLGSSGSNLRSRRNEDPWFLDAEPPYPPQPYRFVYNVKGRDGQTEQYRQEVGDGKHLTGSYGYVLPDGIYRHVDYVADDRGFRAYIRTSEPGTANQNPSNVVINANPLVVAPGVSYASSRADAPDSLAPSVLPLGNGDAILASGQRSSNWQTAKLAEDQERLPLRPPGSIVNTPIGVRNFTSYSYTTPPPPVAFTSSHQLLPPSPSVPSLSPASSADLSGSLWRRNESDLLGARYDPWANEFWRRRQLLNHRLETPTTTATPTIPLLYNNNLTRPSPYHWARDPLPAAKFSPVTSTTTASPLLLEPVQPGNPFSRSFSPNLGAPPAGGGGGFGTKLAYDRPLAEQRDRPAGAPLKMDYDKAYNLESPFLALERSRNLAQLNQLNALGHRFGLLQTIPRVPTNEQSAAVAGGSLAPLSSLGAGASLPGNTATHQHHHESKTTSTSSEEQEERHHRLQEHSTVSSDGSLPQQVVKKEQESGTKSGSMRQFELHQHTNLPNQLPPPPPAFPEMAQPTSGGVKGGAPSRMNAPYSAMMSGGEDSAGGRPDESEPPSRSSQREDSPAKDSPESASEQQAAGTKGRPSSGPSNKSWFGGNNSANKERQQDEPVKGGSSAEDTQRHGMLINHLRSMRQTIGLPQPPRSPFEQAHESNLLDNQRERRRATLSNGLSLADQIVSARMSRVESLLADSRHLITSSKGGDSAPTDGSVVRAGGGDTQLASASGRDSLAAIDNKRTKPVIEPNFSELQLADGGAGAGNGTAFDARRLSRKPTNRLQAEKPSELEKFQQRLRAQQLQQTGGGLPTTVTPTPSKANAQVKYDEEPSQEGKQPRNIGGSTENLGNQRPARRSGEIENELDVDQRPFERRASNKMLNNARTSELAKEISRWPSINGSRNNNNRQHNQNRSHHSEDKSTDKLASELRVKLKAAIGDNASVQKLFNSSATVSDGKSTNNNDADQSTTTKAPANTINLDFINSVTALSVDTMNPFALASVNPSVQPIQRPTLSSPGANESRLTPHKLGELAAVPRGAPNGIATSNARYHSSPELLAALDYHERRDTSAQLRDLMDQPGSGAWASNHKQQQQQQAASSTIAAGTGGAPYMLSAQATSSTPSMVSSSAPSVNLASVSSLTPGYQVRDRALQVDNHRFYEVVTNAAPAATGDELGANRMLWPVGGGDSVAFRDAQLSIPASRQ